MKNILSEEKKIQIIKVVFMVFTINTANLITETNFIRPCKYIIKVQFLEAQNASFIVIKCENDEKF